MIGHPPNSPPFPYRPLSRSSISSSSRTAVVTADCEMLSCSAACEMRPTSATAVKYLSWRRVRDMVRPSWGIYLSLKNYMRSEEHTSELQSQSNLVCRLLLEK